MKFTPANIAIFLSALLICPLAPALGEIVWDKSVELVPGVYVIGLALALLFGAPLFVYLAIRRKIDLALCLIYGFVVGSMPFALFGALSLVLPELASSDDIPTVVHHVPTLAGLSEYLEFVGSMGMIGLLAGFLFWGVLKFGDALTVGQPARRQHAWLSYRTVLPIGVALVAPFAIAAIPQATRDTSCHNMFRDGRTASIGPTVEMNLDIGVSEWPRLRRLFAKFGTDHGLSLKDDSQSQADVVDMLYLDLCSDKGINLGVVEQYWHPKTHEPIPPYEGVPIGIYLVRNDPDWRPIARDFIAQVESTWPGRLQFRDAGGRNIPMPNDLEPTQGQSK